MKIKGIENYEKQINNKKRDKKQNKKMKIKEYECFINTDKKLTHTNQSLCLY